MSGVPTEFDPLSTGGFKILDRALKPFVGVCDFGTEFEITSKNDVEIYCRFYYGETTPNQYALIYSLDPNPGVGRFNTYSNNYSTTSVLIENNTRQFNSAAGAVRVGNTYEVTTTGDKITFDGLSTDTSTLNTYRAPYTVSQLRANHRGVYLESFVFKYKGTTVFDWVPCLYKGKPCMFDKVKKVIFML